MPLKHASPYRLCCLRYLYWSPDSVLTSERMLSSPLRVCVHTGLHLPKGFSSEACICLVLLATLDFLIPLHSATSASGQSYVVPQNLLHPQSSKPVSSRSNYLTCSRETFESALIAGKGQSDDVAYT